MHDAAHNLDQEFWRPPAPMPPMTGVRAETEICSRCNTEFVVGSRFCHVCGASRDAESVHSRGFSGWLDFGLISDATGLNAGSLVAFITGIACLIAAIVTGFIYTATTVLDWQAVQLWRIEWLLAGVAAFVGGMLLKRPS